MANNWDAFSATSSSGSNIPFEEPDVNSATTTNNNVDIDQDTDLMNRGSELALVKQLVADGGEIHLASENHPLVQYVMANKMAVADDFLHVQRADLNHTELPPYEIENIIRRLKNYIAITLARDLTVDPAEKLRDFGWARSCFDRMKYAVTIGVELMLKSTIMRRRVNAGTWEGTSSMPKVVGAAPIVISSSESSSDEN